MNHRREHHEPAQSQPGPAALSGPVHLISEACLKGIGKEDAVIKKNKYNARKIIVDGIEFDSIAESEYYQKLKKDKNVVNIELQPKFQIINAYKVECKRCGGNGRIFNTKTGNYNKCTLCKGKGVRSKPGAIYTADFRVRYIDGYEEVIDVKGGRVSHDFPLRRKLFEILTGKELVVVRKKKGEWVRE